MDFTSVLNRSEPHQRTIIHLDMDYFYAQVEEIRDPTLRSRPLGVQQKNIVVTCNYVARNSGVAKLMLVEEARRLCPLLVLVNGEDLTPYRQMSQRVFDFLLNYTPAVEKLGFDENFLDVSALVEQRLRAQQLQHAAKTSSAAATLVGHVHPSDSVGGMYACNCGCAERLSIGTQLAAEIREDLRLKLGLTCCAGVAYNKLLAKLVGSQHKPNQQTVLVSTYAEQFMRELGSLNRITGIGQKTQQLLVESGVGNVTQLQQCNMDTLRKKCGYETAKKLKDLAHGRDTSAVRASGKPKSIGLEDSCRPISLRDDVEERFRLLLMRLLEQVAEDGRIPIAIKVVLRKFDAQKKTSHRETKQANILPSLFRSDANSGRVLLNDGAQEKLLKIVMRLFERVVDLEKPFNITLIGLAFSKFQQRRVGSASIANFLIKKTDLEVQSITSLSNTATSLTSSYTPTPNSPTHSVSSTNSGDEAAFRSSPTTFQPSDQFYRRRATTASPIPMLVDNGSESAATNSDFSDFSETEIEPSPKKSRISRLLMSKRRCLGNNNCMAVMYAASDTSADVASPSKLRVCDLRLNSRDSDRESPINTCASSAATTTSVNLQNQNVGQRVRIKPTQTTLFNRIDRIESCRRPSMRTAATMRQLSITSSMSSSSNSSPVASPLPSPMDETAFLPTTSTKTAKIITVTTTTTTPITASPRSSSAAAAAAKTTTTKSDNLANVPYPANVDPEVFSELPLNVQNELIVSWRNSLAVAAAASTSNANSTQSNNVGSSTGGNGQKNALYRYFLRNK